MDKILSAILKFIKKIIKRVVAFIKKYWVIILALAIVWFAPQISAWLITAGAPAWLSGAVGALGPLSSVLRAGIGWIGKLPGKLWAADIHWGWKAAAVLGTSLLIFPEETTEMIGGVVEGATDLIGDVVGAVVGGTVKGLGAPLMIGLIALGTYMLVRGGSSSDRNSAGTTRSATKEGAARAKRTAPTTIIDSNSPRGLLA